MADVDGELEGLRRTSAKVDGDSKAFSEDSQAVLRNQRSMIDKLKGVALYKEHDDIPEKKEVSNSLKISTILLIFFIRSCKTLATNIYY